MIRHSPHFFVLASTYLAYVHPSYYVWAEESFRDNQALDSPHENFCSKTRLGLESVGTQSLEAPTKI